MLRVFERVGKPLLEAEFGETGFLLVHTFSCELNPRKRAFIRSMVSPPVLLGPVASLLGKTAIDYAEDDGGRSRPSMPFPWTAAGYVYGFPCKDTRGEPF